MKIKISVLSILILILLTPLYAGVEGNTEVTVDPTDAPLMKLVVKPSPVEFNSLDGKRKLKVIGVYEDESRVNLSGSENGTEYFSDSSSVASVNEEGVITSNAQGTATVRVSNGSVYKDVEVKITVPVLEEIKITPEKLNFPLHVTRRLKVKGHYSDGGVKNITSSKEGTTYEVMNPEIAEVSKNGKVEALTSGDTYLKVENSGLSDDIPVSVIEKNMPVKDLKVKPEHLKFSIRGQVKRLKVIAVLPNGETFEVKPGSDELSYSSSDSEVVSVQKVGLKAKDNGRAYIEVQYKDFRKTVQADVQLATLEDIEIKVVKPTLRKIDEKTRIKVVGVYSDGSRMDISDSVHGTEYKSDNPGVAEVGKNGIITAVGEGVAVITVSNGTIYKSLSQEVNL